MCYRYPGPRCSGHAEALLAAASQKLRDLEALVAEGISTYDQLESALESAYADLREAQDLYDQTPRGFERLETLIQDTGDPTGEHAARLFFGKSQRALGLQIIKMEDRGDIPHSDGTSAHHIPVEAPKEPAAPQPSRGRRAPKGNAATSKRSADKAKPESKTPEVDHTSKPTQCGTFDPSVEVEGYGTFYRSDLSDKVVDLYYVRIEFDEKVTSEQILHATTLVGYAWRSHVRGESVGKPVRDSMRSFVVHADSTKSARDDLGDGLAGFEEKLPEWMNEGTPVRKTDRAGEGTKGTRLIEKLPTSEPVKFRIYYG